MQILFDIANATINSMIYAEVTGTLRYKTSSTILLYKSYRDMTHLISERNFTPCEGQWNINRDCLRLGPDGVISGTFSGWIYALNR